MSFTSGVTSAKQTLSNKYPLATEDDSWFYQAWRGTGNIVTDVNNASALMLGPAMGVLGGVGIASMSPAVAALYTQYGAAMGWKAAEFALWVSIMGPDKAGRFLNALKDAGFLSANYYLRNKAQVDAIGRSAASSISRAPQGAIAPTNKTVDNGLILTSPWSPWW